MTAMTASRAPFVPIPGEAPRMRAHIFRQGLNCKCATRKGEVPR
jgi:hypothetical protein